jgi:hypothetical protein
MPHGTTIRTNGQTLTVQASVSYWTTEALALIASANDDIANTVVTTITTDTTLWFANTATTTRLTVKQLDGTTLFAQDVEVNPGVGRRVLNPLPDVYQSAADLKPLSPLAPAGAVAETFPRAGATIANGATLTSGQLYMIAINLNVGVTVSSITFLSSTTAAVNPTNQWFALYSSDLALLAQTADDTNTAWGASAAKTLAIASPYTTTKSGLHYVGIMVKADTVPTLAAAIALAVSNAVAPVSAGNSSSAGLTDAAPATAGAITGATRYPYAYLS